MGNNAYQRQQLTILSDHYEWTFIKQYPKYLKVKDKNKGIEADLYKVRITDIHSKISIYQYRKDNFQYLVTVYQLLPQQDGYICQNNETVGMYIEHIPYRLTDFGQFSPIESLYILSQVLNGMCLLSQKFGSLMIDENMICFNGKGNCKIWLNQQLTRNQIQIKSNLKQINIVQNIFKIILTRINQNWNQLQQLSKKSLTFQQANIALTKLSTRFDKKINNIKIPFISYVREFRSPKHKPIQTDCSPSKISLKLQRRSQEKSKGREENSLKNIYKSNNMKYQKKQLTCNTKRIQNNNNNHKDSQIQFNVQEIRKFRKNLREEKSQQENENQSKTQYTDYPYFIKHKLPKKLNHLSVQHLFSNTYQFSRKITQKQENSKQYNLTGEFEKRQKRKLTSTINSIKDLDDKFNRIKSSNPQASSNIYKYQNILDIPKLNKQKKIKYLKRQSNTIFNNKQFQQVI